MLVAVIAEGIAESIAESIVESAEFKNLKNYNKDLTSLNVLVRNKFIILLRVFNKVPYT